MTLRAFLLLLLLLVLLFLLCRALLAWLMRRRAARQPQARRDRASHQQCVTVPKRAWRRPDPLIYDQQYLMSQGLAVTWDNPDIHLELGGAVVPSGALAPDTVYEVVARVWNGSTDAPVARLPVHFWFLSFGVGQVRKPIGQDLIDLPVKGAPGCPAFARTKWRTPAAPGHYCLQAELVWSDDANPNNNLGQENTNVKPLNSPNARFDFPVRNPSGRPALLRLEADGYAPPAPEPCGEKGGDARRDDARRRERLARQSRSANPVPAGWRVAITPSELRLEPDAEQTVTVDITSPDGWAGRRAFNVNALDVTDSADHPRLVGGVTLYVTGTG